MDVLTTSYNAYMDIDEIVFHSHFVLDADIQRRIFNKIRTQHYTFYIALVRLLSFAFEAINEMLEDHLVKGEIYRDEDESTIVVDLITKANAMDILDNEVYLEASRFANKVATGLSEAKRLDNSLGYFLIDIL
jgi:predicted hydrolase (HD superfamily)